MENMQINIRDNVQLLHCNLGEVYFLSQWPRGLITQINIDSHKFYHLDLPPKS